MTDDHGLVPLETGKRKLGPVVAELAGLSSLEYDQRRQTEAERLGVRVGTLDEAVKYQRNDREDAGGGSGRRLELPELDPWPEPVDGAPLLDAIKTAVQNYVALPAGAADAISLWVLHTWAFEAFMITPRLAVMSPEKRCGKTTLMTVLSCLVRKPLSASNITAPAVFRTIAMVRPTLLIDEADTFLDKRGELRGVLNAGHLRTGTVIRTVGDDYEPGVFSTWSPVAIALIGRLAGTLEDRSVIIRMRRRMPDEVVKRLRLDQTQDLEVLARQAARWATDNAEHLRRNDPVIPAGLHDRAADNWRPLFAIADRVGGDWPELARDAAIKLSDSGDDDAGSIRVQLLADIREIFADQQLERLPSQAICDALMLMEERPWGEWRNGKPIGPRQVASLLKLFEIAPRSVRIGERTPKGYEISDFADAFARYLPNLSATPQQTQKTAEDRPVLSATQPSAVADENVTLTAGNSQCCAVADQNGGTGRQYRYKL